MGFLASILKLSKFILKRFETDNTMPKWINKDKAKGAK
jgi:hypothetical protein